MQKTTAIIVGLVLVGLGAAHAQEKDTSVTLVQPTAAGGVAIITEGQGAERTKEAGHESAAVQEPNPRKSRVAVLPAVYAQGARSKFERELHEKLGIADPSVIESPGFTGHLIDALVNCRKFDVLEREELQPVVKEIDFGDSDYADIGKCVKIGQMLNADYVVIPEIRFILLVSEKKDVPFIPQTRTRYEGTIGTRMRVVDVRTSRIASSNIGETSYEARQARKDKDRLKQTLTFMDSFFAEAAEKETAVIIDTIYPIKILSITGAQVTLNRGKGANEVGETLKVFRPGELLVDPDTKETLGYSETAVARIKVTAVRPKVAIAQVMETEQGQEVKRLDIARREKKQAYVPESKRGPRID